MSDLYFRTLVQAMGTDYDLSDDLTSLTIEEDDQLADKLSMVVPDPFRVFSYALQEGMKVEVDLGHVDDHSVIFRGLITKVDASFPDDGVPQVTLTAFDPSIRMGFRKRKRQWKDIDMRGIVSKIAREYDFMVQDIVLPKRGNPTYADGIWQNELTDLAFLHELAGKQRCKVFVEARDTTDVFVFKPEQQIMEAPPSLTVHYGRCGVENRLLSFSVNSDVTQRKRDTVLASIDPETGKETSSQSSVTPVDEDQLLGDPFDENLGALARQQPLKAAALTPLVSVAARAYGAILEEVGSEERAVVSGLRSNRTLRAEAAPQASTVTLGITGRGVIEGNKDARAKRTMQIEAVGGRFAGSWYLSQVRHVVDGNGYQTHFTCTR